MQLGWDRAKSFLALNIVLFGLAGWSREKPPLTVALFAFTGISAVLSAGMINISHGYYRAARDQRAKIEEELGLTIRFGTTRTQRGEPQTGIQRYWPKVNTILLMLHGLIALMAFGAALAYA